MCNIFLVSLTVYFVWNQSTTRLLMGVFIYCTFHFLYAVSSLDSYAELASLHTGSADVIVKIAGATFVLFVLLQLVVRLRRNIFTDRCLSLYFSVVMSLVLMGFLVQLQSKTMLQTQGFSSIEAMLLLLWLMYAGLKMDLSKWGVTSRQLYALNIIIAISLIISFYEVFSHLAWARYSYHEQILFRASSFLFNPNLFGMWCAIVTLGLSFMFHRDNDASLKKPILLGLIMVSASLYLSGSRSFIYLLILTLILPLPLIRGKTLVQLVIPVIILLSTFVAISSFSNLMATHSEPDASNGWNSISLVGERIFNAPVDLVKYVLVTIDKEVASDKEVAIDKEIEVAINGRFIGQGRDSGILTLYDDVGWLGLLSIVWLGTVFLVWACKTYWIKRDVASAYALVMLIFYGAIGVSMRYQVFPVWVFIAIGLSPCLTLWRTTMLHTDKN